MQDRDSPTTYMHEQVKTKDEASQKKEAFAAMPSEYRSMYSTGEVLPMRLSKRPISLLRANLLTENSTHLE